jgi:hypothetical protein
MPITAAAKRVTTHLLFTHAHAFKGGKFTFAGYQPDGYEIYEIKQSNQRQYARQG